MKIVINHNNTVELIPESEEEWVTAITALRGDNLLVSGMGRSIALDDDLFSRVYRLEKMIYGREVGPGPGCSDKDASDLIGKRIDALTEAIEKRDNEYVRLKMLFLNTCYRPPNNYYLAEKSAHGILAWLKKKMKKHFLIRWM